MGWFYKKLVKAKGGMVGRGKVEKEEQMKEVRNCLRNNELPVVYGAILERAGQISDKDNYKGNSSII